MLFKVAIKWVEGIQTKLPMCIGGGIWGAARLKPKHRQLYLKYYLPWAIMTGNNARFLQGISDYLYTIRCMLIHIYSWQC